MNTGNSIAVAFDAVATIYDAARPRLVPCFDRFYGTAVRLSSHALRNTAEPDITDLGAEQACWRRLYRNLCHRPASR
ncbi:MAG: hypothetical protein R3D43_05170 [Tepidamorphaceae bacterium]